MQQLPTFNFGLTKNFFFIYRTLSMRQKTKNYRIRGSNAQKNIFILFSKSHTHMGLVCAKNASEKFSRLGTFKVCHNEFFDNIFHKFCSFELWTERNL
jgi:hypothetical protein